MTKVPLDGLYCKEAGSYFSQDYFHRLVIAHRPAKPGKPTDFIVLKPCCGLDTLLDGSPSKYVSGIFWETTTTGRIDFQGTRYKLLVHSNGCIQIVKAGGRGKGL